MNKRYPSTQSMIAFVRAARAGSFSRAANELNLTHSAISQQIHTLEQFVGQPLFMRAGRGSTLTRAGQLFARVLPEGLAQIDQALALVKDRQATAQPLTVAVDNELSQAWLNARLPILLDALPQHRLTFQSVVQSVGQSLTTPDLSLRYGYGDWRDEEYVQICEDRVIAVASPALLERYQLHASMTPEQLLQLPLLGYTRRAWVPWMNQAGLASVEPDTVAVFDNVADLVAAACVGVGVGLVRGLLARDALADGRLLQLTETEVTARYNLYALWPRNCGEQVAVLVDTLQRLARDDRRDASGRE